MNEVVPARPYANGATGRSGEYVATKAYAPSTRLAPKIRASPAVTAVHRRRRETVAVPMRASGQHGANGATLAHVAAKGSALSTKPQPKSGKSSAEIVVHRPRFEVAPAPMLADGGNGETGTMSGCAAMKGSAQPVTPKSKTSLAEAAVHRADTAPVMIPAPGAIGMIGMNAPVKGSVYPTQNKTRRAETVVHRPASVPPNAVGANGGNVAVPVYVYRRPPR